MNDTVLDLAEFMERVQDDKELLVELLDIFADDFGKKRKLLDEAITSEDYEQIRNIAHSLKGASGNISAKDLRQTFLEIEEMGKNSNIEGIGGLISLMGEQFDVLNSRIVEIKQEFGA